MRTFTSRARPSLSRAALAAGSLAVAVLLAACSPLARDAETPHFDPHLTGEGRLSDVERAVHLLNRATYGVTPQDVDAVLGLGERGWLDWQLGPDRIDDAGTDARLLRIPRIEGRVPSPPPDTAGRAAGFAAPPAMSDGPADEVARDVWLRERAAQRQDEGWRLLREAARLELLAGRIRGAAAERLQAEAAALLFDGQRAMSEALALHGQARQEAARRRPPAAVTAWLQVAKLTRAVYSTRQLQEVMTDFWFNHFNVFGEKEGVGVALEDYERTAVRAHVFGRFEDMLVATARHPAMLMYLDASAPPADRVASPAVLNENYARELLELHTLGVHGGYTQADVVAVARAFTGWTVLHRPFATSAPVAVNDPGPVGSMPIPIRFEFRPEWHDRDGKIVLGRTLAAGRGIEDGLDVLQILAHHPSTATHLAQKLVRHFVADDPPPGLVAEISGVFRRTGGDLRAVTRALFLADAFYEPAVFRAKVKRPFDYVASALRVSGADAAQPARLAPHLRALGHLPYAEPSPAGYPSARDAWISAGAMLARTQFALDLAGGRMPGVRIPLMDAGDTDWTPDVESAGRLLGRLLPRLLPGVPTGQLEAVLLDTTGEWLDVDAATTGATVLGIVLGSPVFQWH